jgi:hypothetical protein
LNFWNFISPSIYFCFVHATTLPYSFCQNLLNPMWHVLIKACSTFFFLILMIKNQMVNLILNHFSIHYLCFHNKKCKPTFNIFVWRHFRRYFKNSIWISIVIYTFIPKRHFKTPILKMISTWKWLGVTSFAFRHIWHVNFERFFWFTSSFMPTNFGCEPSLRS